MKKPFFVTFLFIPIIVAFFINLSFADKITDIDGFRGIKWGVSQKEIPGLVKLQAPLKGGKDIDFYTREGDILKIGNYDLNNIIYGFWID